MKIWGKNLLTMNESKKLFKSFQRDAKSVLFTGENINDKLLKKSRNMKKTLNLSNYLIEIYIFRR